VEISLDGTSVKLGITPTETTSIPLRVGLQKMKALNTSLESAINRGDWKEVSNIKSEISLLLQKENYSNLAPIFHKPINNHTGISIETRMQANDTTAEGEMCYITVLRNDTVYIAHDGYGLA